VIAVRTGFVARGVTYALIGAVAIAASACSCSQRFRSWKRDAGGCEAAGVTPEEVM
jgi:hypothetical protein